MSEAEQDGIARSSAEQDGGAMSGAEPSGIVTFEVVQVDGLTPLARPWAVMASSAVQRGRGTSSSKAGWHPQWGRKGGRRCQPGQAPLPQKIPKGAHGFESFQHGADLISLPLFLLHQAVVLREFLLAHEKLSASIYRSSFQSGFGCRDRCKCRCSLFTVNVLNTKTMKQ